MAKNIANIMGRPRKDYMEVKVPAIFGIRRKVKIEFEQKCDELGLNKSLVAEELLINFINEK